MISKQGDITTVKIDMLKTMIEELDEQEQLVFDQEDVSKIQDPLTILFRTIIYTKKITISQFKEMVKNYYIRIGANSKQVAQQPNNILRNIRNEREITAKTFMIVIRNILQLEIRKFDVTFLNYGDLDEKNKPKEERYIVDILEHNHI